MKIRNRIPSALTTSTWIFAFALSCAFGQTGAGLKWDGCPDLQAGDFRKVNLPGTTAATKMVIAPDGRLFYGDHGSGRVWSWDPKTSLNTQHGSVPVVRSQPYGLVGLALDPGFQANNWIYIHYANTPVKMTQAKVTYQVWRYTLANGRLDMASGKMLLEYLGDLGFQVDHSGGAIAFDGQGNLYFSSGDNSWWDLFYGNIDETRIQYNSLRSSGNTNDLRGKIVRIHPEPDGSYTIPPGNLFPPGTDLTRPEIFAMGFRNPWSMNVDKITGTVTWADVGCNGERADARGPAGMDEFGATRTPGNFGWPMFKGPNLAYNNYDYATNQPREFFDKDAPINASKLNTGLRLLPPARSSIVAYGKDGLNNPWPGFLRGGAVPINGPIYHYDGKNPSRIKLPPHFHGKWFVGDAVQKFIKVIELDADANKAVFVGNAFAGLTYPSSSSYSMMGMDIGPDGALYVAQNGDVTFRIEYAGTCLPESPIVSVPGVNGPRPGNAASDRSFFLPPTGARRVTLRAGISGFDLFDAEGRKVWGFRRSGALDPIIVDIPDAVGAGSMLRGLARY